MQRTHTHDARRTTDLYTSAARRHDRRTRLAADREAAAELETSELERENVRLLSLVRRLRARVRMLKTKRSPTNGHANHADTDRRR